MRALPSIAGATALLGLTGCMALGPLARDGDAEVSLDAGLADGPVAPPLDIETGPVGSDASLPGSDAGALAGEADFGDDRSATCFNFIDDDGNGVLDCADPSCASPAVNTACCVASTSTACCIAEASDVVRGSAACTGASSICLEVDGEQLVPTLGDVYSAASLPGACSTVPGPGFAPIGTATSHGYLALPGTYDPAAAYLRVAGRIGVEDVDDRQVAAAGFGLFAPQGMGAIARPLVGVVASATSDDVRVIVGDRVVATERLDAEVCGRSWEYEIRLAPAGTFEVFRRSPSSSDWGAAFASGSYDVTRAARVAMFGQQPNPMAAGPRAWVSDLAVAQSGCDILVPARRSDAVVSAGATQDVTGVTVFPRDATRTAYEALVTSGDQVHWMSARADGLLVSGVADPFAHNIQPTWAGYERFQDVEVLLDGGTHHVFLAAAPAGGTFRILHAEYHPGAAGAPGSLADPAEILEPDDFDDAVAGLDAISVDGVSALRRTGGIGIVLAVRVRYSDGSSAIRIAPAMPDAAGGFASESPDVVGRSADGITTDGLVHASQPHDAMAFDRDEVADPQLIEDGGIVRVLYAGRRGTRWSLGMIVASPDFTHFAPAGRAAFLGPSGAGFDALGVTEPFLVRRGSVDWLYFAGSDGARRGVGLATQPVLGTTP